jgi:hypothetical protein
VEATLVGYLDVEVEKPRVRTLRLATDAATYGGERFEAALRLEP